MKRDRNVPVWSEPEYYDANDAADRRRMRRHKTKNLAKVHDNTEVIAAELFEYSYPGHENDQDAFRTFAAPIVAQGDRYGKWFYFPWSNKLVQYPDQAEYQQLLTSRNRDLITPDEQRKIGSATVLFAGLSVGSHVLEGAVRTGMAGTIILADPDTLSIPNLNRISAGMTEVGMRKTDIAGIRLSELNPYIKQIHFSDGITPQNAEALAGHRPDLMYEHVDHLPTKVLLRRLARQARVALIMATDVGDRSLIDVERYDQGDAEPFLGKLDRDELAALENGTMAPLEKKGLIEKIIGQENISARFAWSMGRIGVTLGGIAQLGTTAGAGGAYAAVAGREILLGRGPASGRYSLSPQAVFGLPDSD